MKYVITVLYSDALSKSEVLIPCKVTAFGESQNSIPLISLL